MKKFNFSRFIVFAVVMFLISIAFSYFGKSDAMLLRNLVVSVTAAFLWEIYQSRKRAA